MNGLIKMVFAYIVLGLSALAYCLYLHFTRTFNYWRNRNIAGPKPVPLFGNLMESALRRTHTAFVMKKIYHDFPNEKVVGVYKMTTPSLLIRDPDIVKRVFIKDFEIFADRGLRVSKDEMGKNLFHADEKTWRILRNKFTPLFTSGKLRNMLYLINEVGDKFIKHVDDLIKIQPEQEIYELIGKFTMASTAACVFGLDLDISKKSATMDALNDINKKLLTLTYETELELLYPGILVKLGTSVFPDELKHFFNHLVAQVIVARNGKPINRNDFMDLLLEMKETNTVRGSRRVKNEEADTLEVTEGIMVAQAFIFYAGGYETSATAMSYMMYYLAMNPEIQEKVVKEMKEVLDRHGGEITYDALKELTYFDRVIHETLRLHSPGEAPFRVAAADYKIPEIDLTIPKGISVVVSNLGLHYDEKYWPEPLKFDPDRFSPENVAKRHSAVYLPYGIGPRNCIGVRFAKTQIRAVMMKLLSRFRVVPTEKTRKEFKYNTYNLVQFPIEGISMKLVPRH